MSLLYAKCVHDLFQRASEAQSIYAFRKKPTLKPMQALCRRMKNPQSHYKCIHIGGTNGKGSTSTKLATALSMCGYRVGLFTSPHISSVRERIKVNGKMISKLDFVSDFSKIMHYEQDINYKLSFFEIMNAIAFYHFKRIGVDFAIIEVGVGGTWDSTNVIESPLMSIIVSISLDHTQLLGDTIEQIARDKCGIIKKGRPAVIGMTVPLDIAKQRAQEMDSGLFQIRSDEMGPFETYDDHNSCLARYALDILNRKYFILPKSIDELSRTLHVRPPCRMESVRVDLYKLLKALCHSKESSKSPKSPKNRDSPKSSKYPLLSSSERNWLRRFIASDEVDYEQCKHALRPIDCMLDVAHNPDAFQQFFHSLITRFPSSQYTYRVVLGMNPRKQFVECCQSVTEHADYVHLVSSHHKTHCMEIGKLKRVLVEQCGFGEDRIFEKGKGDIFREIMYALNECFKHNHSKQEVNVMSLSDTSTNSTKSTEKESQRSVSKESKSQSQQYKTEIVVVMGSFYIMNEARKGLGLRYDDDQDDLKRYHVEDEDEVHLSPKHYNL